MTVTDSKLTPDVPDEVRDARVVERERRLEKALANAESPLDKFKRIWPPHLRNRRHGDHETDA